jgi:hypothetical protein
MARGMDRMCRQEVKKRKPSARSFIYNLGGDRPWFEKAKLFLRNNWIKVKNVQNCCGHPGEPGC